MKRRGLTMVELMITAVMLTVLMTGLFSLFLAMNGAQSFAQNIPQAQYNAEHMTETVAAAIRKATIATSLDTTCTLNSCVESASSASLTVYSGATGSITKTVYFNSGSSVLSKVGSGTASTLESNASISYVYYTASTYHSGSLTTATTGWTTPTLVAVKVTGTCSSGGRSVTYSTLVRLRNGPLRTSSTS